MVKRIFLSLGLILILSFFTQAQIDLSVQQSNLTHCDTTGITNLYIIVHNVGTVPAPSGNIDASYKVNGGSFVTQTFLLSSPLSPGDSVAFMFSTQYHFNQFTTYNCIYTIDYSGDINEVNDTSNYTRTFFELPGFGAHSGDTAVCLGSPATLMMELTGNDPWLLTIVMGADTIFDLPVMDSVLSTEMTLDSTTVFQLLYMTDVNGCYTYIGMGIIITIDTFPLVELGIDTSVCADDILILDAGNTGATFNWWDGPGSQTYIADTSDWAGVLGSQLAWVDVTQNTCTTRDSIYINWITCPGGLGENENPTFKLYPNPTDGFLNINFQQTIENGQLIIEDIIGQVVYKENFNQKTNSTKTLDFEKFENGIYFIVINYDGINIRQKVVVDRK
jgi:hypothetical protein